MTFQDLQEAIARLASDPRVHPSTRIELAYSYDLYYETPHTTSLDVTYGRCQPHVRETVHESEPLVCVLLNGCITLSAERAEPAIAR